MEQALKREEAPVPQGGATSLILTGRENTMQAGTGRLRVLERTVRVLWICFNFLHDIGDRLELRGRK